MEEHLFGRETTLYKLNRDRNNPKLSKIVRKRADEAMTKILKQLKDKKLMQMRTRLIAATRDGNQYEVWKIEQQMKEHEGREREKVYD